MGFTKLDVALLMGNNLHVSLASCKCVCNYFLAACVFGLQAGRRFCIYTACNSESCAWIASLAEHPHCMYGIRCYVDNDSLMTGPVALLAGAASWGDHPHAA